MKAVFSYHGYDGKDHVFESRWATDSPDLCLFLAGRDFQKMISKGEEVEPAYGQDVTVTDKY
jgi:hypothetical protein